MKLIDDETVDVLKGRITFDQVITGGGISRKEFEEAFDLFVAKITK